MRGVDSVNVETVPECGTQMTRVIALLLFASLLLLGANQAAAQVRALADIVHGDQRLVLGVPDYDVGTFIDEIVERSEYAVHSMDLYSVGREPFFNFILGPRDRSWWVASAIDGDRYPDFIRGQEAEGWCVVSSEMFEADGERLFVVLLKQQGCVEQLRFVYVKPSKRKGYFLRDFDRNDRWEARSPLSNLEANGPVGLPSGYVLSSMRLHPGGLTDNTVVVYERKPNADVRFLHARNFGEFLSLAERWGREGYWIADLDVASQDSVAGLLDTYSAIAIPVTGPTGPVQPLLAEDMRAHLANLPDQRIMNISGFETRDGVPQFWIQTEPRR